MGMFDSVMIACPHCGTQIEFQSKAGECVLATYDEDKVPVEIAVDILNDVEICEKCGNRVGVSSEIPNTTISVHGIIQ